MQNLIPPPTAQGWAVTPQMNSGEETALEFPTSRKRLQSGPSDPRTGPLVFRCLGAPPALAWPWAAFQESQECRPQSLVTFPLSPGPIPSAPLPGAVGYLRPVASSLLGLMATAPPASALGAAWPWLADHLSLQELCIATAQLP